VPRPRFEDRYVSGGQPLPARWNAAAERWEPVLGEERGASSRRAVTHAAMTGKHIHEHHDYGQGTPPAPGQRLGIHIHEHEHHGDAAHSPGRDGHRHRVSGTPGNPDASTPSAQLSGGAPGGETRGSRQGVPARQREDAGMGAGLEDIDLGAAITAYLAQQGVNVDRALERAQTAAQSREQRARRRMEAAGHAAYQLRAAKRALAVEQEGFLSRRPGCGIAKVAEAQERVTMAEAALAEACLDDPATIAQAKRRAAR